VSLQEVNVPTPPVATVSNSKPLTNFLFIPFSFELIIVSLFSLFSDKQCEPSQPDSRKPAGAQSVTCGNLTKSINPVPFFARIRTEFGYKGKTL
jgi:hypothetical protein